MAGDDLLERSGQLSALADALHAVVADSDGRIVLGELATDRGVARLAVPPLSADAVAQRAASYPIASNEVLKSCSIPSAGAGNRYTVSRVPGPCHANPPLAG
jgi:hypothetical protein